MAEELNDTEKWTTITIGIPPELTGYEPDLKRFWDAMIFKLRRNDHKGKWDNIGLTKAQADLAKEGIELAIALDRGNTLEIWTEAADVANMALIVAAIALENQGV